MWQDVDRLRKRTMIAEHHRHMTSEMVKESQPETNAATLPAGGEIIG
jgi:hypothetical protein